MLCSNCGQNEAAVYISRNINGKVTSGMYCRECAAKMGAGGLGLLSGLDLVGMLGAAKDKPKKIPLGSSDPSKRCTACGRSFNEIASSGMVGCAVCYKSFADELDGTITGIHGTAVYTGRHPGKNEPVIEPLENIIKDQADPQPVMDTAAGEGTDLRALLLEAVKNENYEEAARLRDLIKASEAETGKEGE